MSFKEGKNSPLITILTFYIGTLLMFTVLFLLPFSTTKSMNFLDALFLSASALSCTGLSTFDINSNLTFIGKIILLFQIQFGGIGIMVLITCLFLLIGKELSLPQLLVLSADQNQKGIKSIKLITLLIFLIAFISETIGFAVLYPTISKIYTEPMEAYFITIFHSVSSFTGAGFDLFGSSMISFQNNHIFLLATAFLVFLGVLGFPTLIELFTKRGKKKSIFTKVNLITHGFLIVFGFITLLLLEYKNSFRSLNFIETVTNSLFLSVTSRNGGLTSIDISSLSISALLIIMFLMFVGASPSSCGGGIRTTTFAVILAKIWSIIKGKEEAVIFNKSIPNEDINKAFLILFSFASLFFVSLFIFSIYEDFNIVELSFEIISSLTTTGLSLGITSELHWFTKLWLIFLMIVGRIGVVAWIYLFIKPTKSRAKYIKESIIVG